MIGRVRQGLFHLMALLLSVAITLLTTPITAIATPRGTQCPTAKVQKIIEVRYVQDCCGNLVPQVIERAPREGESGFKQCQCAEKKSAETQSRALTAETKPFFVIWVQPRSQTPSWTEFGRLDSGAIARESQNFSSISKAPQPPPPRLI